MKRFKFKKVFKKVLGGVVTLSLVLMFSLTSPINVFAAAAVAPILGAARTFGVLSSTFTNSNTAPQTIITGDIGYSVAGAPVTPPTTVVGTLHPEDATRTLAGTDQGTALTTLTTQPCTTIAGPLNATIIGSNAAGTFPPGCYTMSGALVITVNTTVTLDLTATGGAGGNVWIFKSTGGGITTGGATGPGFPNVLLANGASECNVFWTAIGATSIGANYELSATPTFVGTIIDTAGITLGHFANLLGRALDYQTTVTTDANTITVPTCAAQGTLHVTKTVVNTGGGTKVPGDFTMSIHAFNSSQNTSFPGDADGTSTTLDIGAYTVTETGPTGYTSSGDCSGTITAGVTSDCTITNTYLPPVIPPVQLGGSYMPPVFLPSINIISTPVVIAPIIPKLPKTGFPPQEKNTMLPIVILSGLSLVSIFLYFAQKKQTT